MCPSVATGKQFSHLPTDASMLPLLIFVTIADMVATLSPYCNVINHKAMTLVDRPSSPFGIELGFSSLTQN